MTTRNEQYVYRGGPAREYVLVTKSDSDQDPPLIGLRVYVAQSDAPATLKVTPIDQTDPVTLTYPQGVFIEPIGVVRVWSTGSTANAIVHGVPARLATT